MISLDYPYTYCREKGKNIKYRAVSPAWHFVNYCIRNSISGDIYLSSLEVIPSGMNICRHKVLDSVAWFYKFVLNDKCCPLEERSPEAGGALQNYFSLFL